MTLEQIAITCGVALIAFAVWFAWPPRRKRALAVEEFRLRNRIWWLRKLVATGRHPDTGSFVARGPYRIRLHEAERELTKLTGRR